jgi:serine/threonine protein kinase
MEQPQLGRYVIESEIGRGAMGVVFKATDSVLQRVVAVKTVNMALEREHADKYEARFYQEARAAGGLNHPNIVTVYDAGKAGDVVYMAMEYIQGVELRTLLTEGQPMGVSQALSIAAQVAEGLAYAHQAGVVHRDIKPANIMVVADGPVKITDFGIARMRASADLTQTGVMLGSPKYMSPEQVIGKRADHRSDIFSLGVILYEMVSGTAPFSGENVTALMYQIVNFAPPAPSAVNRAVPEMLDFIVAKMLAKLLEERYPDARELARDLRECERSLAAPPGATAPGHPAGRSLAAPPGATAPGHPAGLATGTHPQIVDTQSKTVVLVQPVNRTREQDAAGEPSSGPPARGVSNSFDSIEATQRLAVLTGTATAPQTATQALGAIPRPPRAGWRRRDWLLVGGAALAGVLVAGAVLKRRKEP